MRIKRGTNGGLIIPPLAKRHLMWKKQLEMKHEPFAACSEAHQLARNFLYCSLWDIALKVFYTLQYIYDLILTRTQTVWWFVIFSCCVFFFFFFGVTGLKEARIENSTVEPLKWRPVCCSKTKSFVINSSPQNSQAVCWHSQMKCTIKVTNLHAVYFT